MSNLSVFKQDGIEIYIDTENGESFASISGYSRMSGKARSTISDRIKGMPENEILEAETLTAGEQEGCKVFGS